ncbi:hypothetical protein C2W62_31640 [Candidatus Entotheonella serta]|nr:hypothetical protein C2W62_31640 [Candidatus Entotheonella serta]
MRYGLLLVFIGSIFFTIVPTAQAGMKDFCAIRWHDNAAMQQYCLAVQDQSTERLAMPSFSIFWKPRMNVYGPQEKILLRIFHNDALVNIISKSLTRTTIS